MEAFDTTRSLIDIKKTAKKHGETVPWLIGVHALSSRDSVPKLYGIENKTVIKHLKNQNLSLPSLGDTAESLTNFYGKSTKLTSSSYGVKNMNNLSEVWFSFWGKRTGKKLTSTPRLESLPPTREVFLINVLHANYQTCAWNSCLQPRPSKMDPCQVRRLIIESGPVLFFIWLFDH